MYFIFFYGNIYCILLYFLWQLDIFIFYCKDLLCLERRKQTYVMNQIVFSLSDIII